MLARSQLQVPPRPFLKWAGGKTRLISQYKDYFPTDYRTYHEPFVGGGAVFFHLLPERAVLTDINADLINAYRCVRDDVDGLIERLEVHKNNHSSSYYYEVRSRFRQLQQLPPSDDKDLDRAACLMYLNKTCFNGLYRENTKGEFNVPIGRYKNPIIYDPQLLYSASMALQLAKIEVRSFESICDRAMSGDDFVYFDPPYHPLNDTSRFTSYSRNSFGEDDQIRLRDVFAKLAESGVKVMLSNSDCPLIRELYSDFHIHSISAGRAINSNGKKRGNISELLVTSYPVE